MVKIDELTDLKAIAILLLFFVHSNLQISANLFSVAVQEWMLSTFFFVSGYLTWIGFTNRQKSIRAFTLHRFVQVYIPFVVIMAFYVFAYPFVVYSFAGFLSHASFLSLLNVFSEGQFEMYQFWFIPDLLAFGTLYIILGKYVERSRWRLGIITAILILDVVAYAFTSPFRLEYNIGLYLLLFAFGYEIASNHLIDRIRHLHWTLIPLIIVAVASVYVLFTYLGSPDLSTVAGRAIYFSSSWAESIVFSTAAITVVLVVIYHLRKRFPKSRLYTVSLVLAGSSLFMYLLEGYISAWLGKWVFGAGWYVTDITDVLLLPSIAVRIAVVTVVAYFLQKGYNKMSPRIEYEILKRVMKENNRR